MALSSFSLFFVPAGCLIGLLPLLVDIEFISYLAINIYLDLRLGANIVADHLLLHILSTFTYQMLLSGFFWFGGSYDPFSYCYSIFGYGSSNCNNPSISFCCFNLFLYQRWALPTLKKYNGKF